MTPITIKKVNSLISGDPLNENDLRHAREGAKNVFPGQLSPLCHLRSGAKVSIKYENRRFKYVVQGYAPDGSDIPT